MIHGYMATFGAYGSWLPNDPRGSRSNFVGSRRLYRAGGPATNRESLPYSQLDVDQRQQLDFLKQALQRPSVLFSDGQIERIGLAICQFVELNSRDVWALSVLPWHTHMVFARGQVSSETFVEHLKCFVHEKLVGDNLLPPGFGPDHCIWAVGQWINYLDSEPAIEDAIHYCNANLGDIGMSQQNWSCVSPFRGIEPNIIKYWD